MFDSHWGKYQNPLAALSERWVLDGDFGEESWSDEGEGSILWAGPQVLTWSDGRLLMDEYGCTLSEVDALRLEVDHSQGVLHSWDDRGFIYAMALDTVELLTAARESIQAVNAGLAVLEELGTTELPPGAGADAVHVPDDPDGIVLQERGED